MEKLLDIVPLTASGERGVTIIIAVESYDTWLQRRGPELLAEGYVRLVTSEHVPYEAQQWSLR